ncbi:MAG: TatD family hydrolase [Sedimentisphaerales bacterium]|nr:TatD family hydrolase [Sedimentisphaerales bacterium]
MTYQLIDCHVHLQAEAFKDDLPEVLDRARQAGVAVLLCNGSEPGDWDQVKDLAGQQYGVRIVPFFGLHPWYVPDGPPAAWLTSLEGLLRLVPSGVGEIGLDRWIQDARMELQLPAFRAQLALARELGRPACIHCLRAWGLLMEELQRFGPFPAGLIIHAYGGSVDLLEPLSRLNAFFSFAGNCLQEGRKRAQQALLKTPLDRLLLESDAPDLPPPEGYRLSAKGQAEAGYRNEPANLRPILEGVARLRSEQPDLIARVVWENAQKLIAGLL